jgi:cAMP-dependent protein kinase regulator
MFSSLNPDELTIVLDAMQSFKKKPGQAVITEGEEGDCLYVVESGVLTCTKIFVRFFYCLSIVSRKGKLSRHF